MNTLEIIMLKSLEEIIPVVNGKKDKLLETQNQVQKWIILDIIVPPHNGIGSE